MADSRWLARVGREAESFTAKEATREMKVMARVEHSSRGFERERDDVDPKGHKEHGKKDVREDRTEDARDE
jgi:hypothetical protein